VEHVGREDVELGEVVGFGGVGHGLEVIASDSALFDLPRIIW
jgi:hypothetical protein